MSGLGRAHDRWRDPMLTGITAIVLIMLFVIAPLQAADVVDPPLFGIVFLILMTAALTIAARSLLPVVAMLAVACLVGTTLLLRPRGGDAILDVVLESIAWLVVSLVMTVVTARVVFGPGRVTYHRVIGAVLLYLAIGLVFVTLYTLVGVTAPRAFAGLTVTDNDSLLSEMIYFSFVTLTTVGFGDITPVHPVARGLCNLEAIVGQLYPATLLARLVTLEIEGRK